MSHVRYTTLANLDLEETVRFLAKERGAATAHRFVERIDERCRAVAEMPGMGRSREELAAGLRSVPEGNHVIFYRPAPDGIEVVRILYGARDIEAVFRDMESSGGEAGA